MLQFGINFARATIQIIVTGISSAWNTQSRHWEDLNPTWDELD